MVGLRKGSKGPSVQKLQYLLNFHLRGKVVRLSPDGDFGALTHSAVGTFQVLNGILNERSKDFGAVTFDTAQLLYNFRSVYVTVFAQRSNLPGQAPVARPAAFGFAPVQSFPPLQVQPGPFPLPPVPPVNLTPRHLTIGPGGTVKLPEKGRAATEWSFFSVTLDTTLLMRSNPDVKLAGGAAIDLSPGKVAVQAKGEFSIEKLVRFGDLLSLDFFIKAEAEKSLNKHGGSAKLLMGPKLTLEVIPERLSVETELGLGLLDLDLHHGEAKAGAAVATQIKATILKF